MRGAKKEDIVVEVEVVLGEIIDAVERAMAWLLNVGRSRSSRMSR